MLLYIIIVILILATINIFLLTVNLFSTKNNTKVPPYEGYPFRDWRTRTDNWRQTENFTNQDESFVIPTALNNLLKTTTIETQVNLLIKDISVKNALNIIKFKFIKNASTLSDSTLRILYRTTLSLKNGVKNIATPPIIQNYFNNLKILTQDEYPIFQNYYDANWKVLRTVLASPSNPRASYMNIVYLYFLNELDRPRIDKILNAAAEWQKPNLQRCKQPGSGFNFETSPNIVNRIREGWSIKNNETGKQVQIKSISNIESNPTGSISRIELDEEVNTGNYRIYDANGGNTGFDANYFYKVNI